MRETTRTGEPGTTMIHIRVDQQIKAQATEALAKMGMTLSEAVRVLLVRVAKEQEFPFAIRVPNATTLAAMAEVEARKGKGGRFATAEAMFDALAKDGR